MYLDDGYAVAVMANYDGAAGTGGAENRRASCALTQPRENNPAFLTDEVSVTNRGYWYF